MTPTAILRTPGGWALSYAPARPVGGWADVGGARRLVQLPYGFPRRPGRWYPIDVEVATLDGILPAAPPPRVDVLVPAWDRAGHIVRVRAIHEAIAAGAVYQANLGCTWRGRLLPHPDPARALFAHLAANHPARFDACLVDGDMAVVGNSPELLLSVENGLAVSEPIKGTRRRAPGAEAELMASVKERAELAMITDLVRNDLGRVAVPGSVRVAEPGAILHLPHLLHRYARVEARLPAGRGVSAALEALFPAGSITGAPKLAAMRLLDGLECADRGAWCGAYGLVDGDDGVFAVAIRTVELAPDASVVVRAGGGIVADSEPEAEWDEARAKASAIAAALGSSV